MDQGQIVCSFCTAEFTVPPGLNEAICPKCGKAMPLFKTSIGVGQAEGFPPREEEEEIWDTVEDFQEDELSAEPDAIGRIALKQVPANQVRQPRRTMMGQGGQGAPGLSSLVTTDQDGQLIPDVIRGGGGEGGAGVNGSKPAPKRPLESGFNLGLEAELSSAEDDDPASGVRPLAGLTATNGTSPGRGMPNLLDELDAELDNALPEDDDDIPEAEPLMEMSDEVSDFFESEQTPGLVLPDDGAIAVNIPEAPVQERMRNQAVSMSSSDRIAPVTAGDTAAGESGGSQGGSVSPDLTPVLRTAIFVGLGVGVLLLVGLLYWLIQ